MMFMKAQAALSGMVISVCIVGCAVEGEDLDESTRGVELELTQRRPLPVAADRRGGRFEVVLHDLEAPAFEGDEYATHEEGISAATFEPGHVAELELSRREWAAAQAAEQEGK